MNAVLLLPLKGVQLGSRWQPGAIERRDTETGYFEAVNPPLDSHSDILMQRALLKRIAPAQARAIERARTAKRIGGAA